MVFSNQGSPCSWTVGLATGAAAVGGHLDFVWRKVGCVVFDDGAYGRDYEFKERRCYVLFNQLSRYRLLQLSSKMILPNTRMLIPLGINSVLPCIAPH